MEPVYSVRLVDVKINLTTEKTNKIFMRKTFIVTIWLVVFSLVAGLPIGALAVDVSFTTDTTVTLPNGKSLTILSGSDCDSFTVYGNSSIEISADSSSTMTIRSTDKYQFDSTAGSQSCGSSANDLTISGVSGSVSLTVTDSTCSVTNYSGGGGGGGGSTNIVPTNTTISIAGGASQTESREVTLTLGATDVTLMSISNYANFSDASSWLTYQATKSWTLLAGEGTKTVYAKFRSSSGSESTAISDSIELVSAVEPVSGGITGETGGTAILNTGKVRVDVPAGAVSGSGTISITPIIDYTVPVGLTSVVGNKVYDLSANIVGEEVSTFNQPLTLTFTYTSDEIQGLNESTLAIYYWNETTNQWVSLGGTVDSNASTIKVNVTHFTKFAIIGEIVSAGGDLVKLECAANAGVNDPCKAVYYLGNNGKRYVFPNEKTYRTWYSDFSGVKIISASDLASYMIGGNVTYRPGVKLVKIQTDSKVYAVDKNGSIRWIETAEAAQSIYGADWSKLVEDISDAFFVNYTAGDSITGLANYNKTSIQNASPDINTDKGL